MAPRQLEWLPVPQLQDTAKDQRVCDAMRRFYSFVDREIARQPGTCWNKAACCRFGVFGHRLYVTALEVSYYLSGIQIVAPVTGDSCPHAHSGMCHMREFRPLGCRMFYCDPKAADWQAPMTERFLAQLRDMHTQFEVSYFYADWMDVLMTLDGSSRQ